ncbi:MAG: hypothetical protein GYA57_03030 [Myxococcales bacterium]|nr:hypothetical protein [Myxococcales bacterium]
MRSMPAVLALVWLAGCGDDGATTDDGGFDEGEVEAGADADADADADVAADADADTDADGDADADLDVAPDGEGDAPEDAAPPGLAILRPAEGDLVLETAVVDFDPGALAADALEVWVDGETDPRCVRADPPWRCLVHLDPRARGTATIRVVARAAGAEIDRATVGLVKEPEFTEECATDSLACVRDLVAAGTAAGWDGVVYENMDGLHANLDTSGYPGVTRIENSDALSGRNPGSRPQDLDTATVLLGNASVAQTSPCCFSVPRRSLSLSSISDRFRENKLWWYPEHRDHGYEDYYWFSTVTVGISQGSSGSEIDELRSLMLALGALPPEARAALQEAGQVWSALQYVSRRTRMAGDAAYLTTQAHPNALADGGNLVAMMQMARAFAADRLPPAARLEVLDEDFATGERRLTTPESVARVWTDTTATEHRLRVSASPSVDLTGRPLTYHWFVLRAVDWIDVVPEDADGSVVALTIRRHPEETLELNGQPRRTSLGVVALFVHNGLYFSPPAFVTSFTADPYRLAPNENNLD